MEKIIKWFAVIAILALCFVYGIVYFELI